MWAFRRKSRKARPKAEKAERQLWPKEIEPTSLSQPQEKTMPAPKFDIHANITTQIISAIEEGCPPWRKPWTGGDTGTSLPLRSNGEPYRGINVLVLWSIAASKGYASARWLTFNQAKTLGGSVRKGEKSAAVVKFGTVEKEDEQGKDKIVPYLKSYSVFNADQIDGLPEEFYRKPEPARDMGTFADPTMEAFFAATGATIETSERPRAFYDIKGDLIHMPPIATFLNAAGYYGTLAHELTHWTGATSRLDRFGRFADRKAYAFEELIAEIGNCLICATLGLTPDFAQSGAYIEGWLRALKDDNRTIFRAASEAQKAVDFILAQAEARAAVAAE
jgi:antirestriction protein ArdC